MPLFTPGQQIHIVGIGGSGMSAIARVLLLRGLRVSGSDRQSSALTEALARDGATIFTGHDAAHVRGADLLLTTSAVPPDHVELAAARAQGIPVYKRNEIMLDLLAGQRVIAVAGTHGKTTTTALVTHILRECGVDPSYIVGGVMGNTGTNAGVGSGGVFVIEADEYDHMFLGLRPDVAVINNIEWDHPDFFKTPDVLYAAFERFGRLLPPDGTLIAGFDSPLVVKLCAVLQDAFFRFTFGTHERAFWRVQDVQTSAAGQTSFTLSSRVGLKFPVRLPLSGVHNALNATAAVLACMAVSNSLTFQQILPALASFKSTGRRFEIRGVAGGVTVVDDYAHHPTAIRLTLEAARARFPGQAIWAVWQPHTYSRTAALLDDYARAFDAADHVLVMDIYAAREQPVPGVDGAGVAAALRHPDARHAGSLVGTTQLLLARVQPPAVIVLLSAGDAPQVGVDYLAARRT